MDCRETTCPRCSSKIELDRGYEGEGGISYCCEYAFYWNREWTVEVTKDNQRSYDELILSQSAASQGSAKENK